MKLTRLLLAIVFVFASMGASAQGVDRDILLTPEGKLFTVESVYADDFEDLETSSDRVLHMTIQDGEEIESVFVPASLGGGLHNNAALAWDSESQSLFIFWQRTPNPQLTSELLFASYREGAWSEPSVVENGSLHLRSNLRIATTSIYFQEGENESLVRRTGLIIHATWWNETGYGEDAGYAMLALENGAVRSIVSVDLLALLGENRNPNDQVVLPENYDRTLFKHPAIFENATHDSVDLVFADALTSRFHKVTVKPVKGHGVLLPPIGIWGGSFGPPTEFYREAANKSGRITVIPGTDPAKFIFYYRGKDKLEYMTVNGSAWSEVRPLALSEKVSAEAGVEALRRLIASQ